jgi:hypothetical protein
MTPRMNQRWWSGLYQLIFYFSRGFFYSTEQFEFDFQEYIHRVGRTARGEKGKGSALLFLLPQELKFLIYLKVIILCTDNSVFSEVKEILHI